LPIPGLLGGHERRDQDGGDGWRQERSGHRTGQQCAVRQRVVQADQQHESTAEPWLRTDRRGSHARGSGHVSLEEGRCGAVLGPGSRRIRARNAHIIRIQQ